MGCNLNKLNQSKKDEYTSPTVISSHFTPWTSYTSYNGTRNFKHLSHSQRTQYNCNDTITHIFRIRSCPFRSHMAFDKNKKFLPLKLTQKLPSSINVSTCYFAFLPLDFPFFDFCEPFPAFFIDPAREPPFKNVSILSFKNTFYLMIRSYLLQFS